MIRQRRTKVGDLAPERLSRSFALPNFALVSLA
jgi:hypothetical protein